MATEFAMPKLGLTMEEGTIVEWLLPEGAAVEAGVAALIVATDKVETEVEAPASGRLHRMGEVGATYRCGDRIAVLLGEGDEPGDGAAAGAGPGQAVVQRQANGHEPDRAAAV